MKVVGITGGIGSGKTTVAKMFQDLGIPLYIADERAKALMNSSDSIKKKLIGLFGKEAYVGDALNRPFLASKIFQNSNLLKQMNAIVHPEVRADFDLWQSQQEGPYVLKEAAIIFENQMELQYDFIITVVADLDKRIARVIKRDNTTENKVLAIVKNQFSDEEKAKASHFVITNHELHDTKVQVIKIHEELLRIINEN